MNATVVHIPPDMNATVVHIPPDKRVIQPSSWPKKELADVHVEGVKFCGFGCAYCSSGAGMHLKMRKNTIAQAMTKATGEPFEPLYSPDITIAYRDWLKTLERELAQHSPRKGTGKTLVYSQLTDGFSPHLLKSGLARRILERLVEGTSYRIRVLTKNAIVGTRPWIQFFDNHRDRFVVGLSIGSLDDGWARRMEKFTSTPTARAKALRALQDAGIPTYGMLCPMFPDVLDGDHLERLVDAIRPDQCEHVWAEPYNDRQNWAYVRAVFDRDSASYRWMTDVYENGRFDLWSRYTTDLYRRIHDTAIANGWSDKLRFLLYEANIADEDAKGFSGLDGVLLQSKPAASGLSQHPLFARMQRRCRKGAVCRSKNRP